MNITIDGKDYITKQDAAKRLCLGLSGVRKRIKDRRLDVRRIGGELFVEDNDKMVAKYEPARQRRAGMEDGDSFRLSQAAALLFVNPGTVSVELKRGKWPHHRCENGEIEISRETMISMIAERASRVRQCSVLAQKLLAEATK